MRNHPSYIFTFEEEKSFDHGAVIGWMEDYWFRVVTIATVIYLVFIFSVQSYLKEREGFDLRRPLALWSFCLAVFSIIGAQRLWTEFLFTYERGGISATICDPSFLSKDRVAGFWFFLFVISKILELVDTVFIVLRKQKLIFLHWYHHLSVMYICFYSYVDGTSSSRIVALMNYTVHSLMYSYYTLRALKIRVPKAVNILITSLQILQMIIGICLTLQVFYYLHMGYPCSVTLKQNTIGSIIYFSYFLLFARFFYETYISPSKSPKKTKIE